MAESTGMIEPFETGQMREVDGHKIVSYGTSSYGYDIRCSREFKIFTNINSTIVDPKEFDARSFVDFQGDVCIIPPNSFALARTVEYFRIPRNVLVLCLGKSTYARCGIIVNVTPLEPEWEGYVTLEFSNTTPLPAKIYANEGVAQVIFFESDEVCETSYKDRGGKYQGQQGVTCRRFEALAGVVRAAAVRRAAPLDRQRLAAASGNARDRRANVRTGPTRRCGNVRWHRSFNSTRAGSRIDRRLRAFNSSSLSSDSALRTTCLAAATSKFASVTIIAVCQVAAMALWFSASAVVPALVAEFRLSGFAQAALTSGVQAGFVVGCLVSALLRPSRSRRPAAAVRRSARSLGAARQRTAARRRSGDAAAPLLRLVTGIALAGVYPVGMKLAATWAKGDMGLMVGILVGALTLGSALPHLFNALGRLRLAHSARRSRRSTALWRGVLIGFAGLGPNRAPSPPFDPRTRS